MIICIFCNNLFQIIYEGNENDLHEEEDSNFERLCRVCLKASDFSAHLFLDDCEADNNQIAFADLINQCSDIPLVSFFLTDVLFMLFLNIYFFII